MKEPWKQKVGKTPCKTCGNTDYGRPYAFHHGEPFCKRDCWEAYQRERHSTKH